MKRAIITTGYLITTIVILCFGWIYLFGPHLPYINDDPEKLARYLLDHHRDPSECWDIVIIDPFGPQGAQIRANCIYTYASLAKDPSACELLMPSSYGLSCVGGAIESPECGFNSGYEVQWNEGNPVVKSSLKNCQKNIKRSITGDACCFIAKIGFAKDENDCSPLKNQERFYNECLDRLSFKNHDPSTCEGITDKNLKIACIVRAKAMKQDPSICTGCTPLLETLEDIR